MSKKETKMIASNFNLQEITTKDYASAIEAATSCEGNVAVFGRRGSGKTMIAKQKIKELGFSEVYWNLSTMERVDVGGYPDLIGATDEFVKFKLPSSYTNMIKGDKKVVVLMDEVDKADPSLWAPLLEFTQFHTINGRHLPNLVSVIMTGNLISEGGQKPCLPLLDRVSKFIIKPDVQSWQEWAGMSGLIHPSVSAYIHDNSEDLYGDVDPDNSYADPSPRGWEIASKYIKMGDEKGWGIDKTYRMVAGCVGNTIGIKYRSYFEHYHKILPLVKKLFDGHDVTSEFKALSPTERVIVTMVTCSRLTNQLDKESSGAKVSKETDKMLTNAGKLLLITDPEYCMIAIRAQVDISRLVKYDLDSHATFGKALARVKSFANGGK
jgi:hypothetical protein